MRYLIGTGNRNWNDPNIWSLTSGGAPYKPASGVEKITNHTFDTSTGWSEIVSSGKITVSGGTANFTAIQGYLRGVLSNRTSGKWYKVSYKISSSNNGTLIITSHAATTIPSTVGNHSVWVIDTNYESSIIFYSSGFIGSIDDVYCEEVDTIAPDATTSCIFDNNSGTGTITVNAIANMLDFTCSNIGALTLANAAYAFNVYGSLTLHTNLTVTFTSTGYLYMKATDSRTITTNGKVANWNRMYFDGVGGTWTNQDDMGANNQHQCILTNGHWNTNGKTINIRDFITASGTKILTLGASVFTCYGWQDNQPTNFTFNKDTSTVITGANIFGTKEYYNLTISPILSVVNINILSNINVSNNFTIAGLNATTKRHLIASNPIGTPRTITCNGTITASNVDFRDITLAGTANRDLSAITGGSGDCGGNSGITFTPAQAQYFKKYASTANYGDAANWFTDLSLTVAGRVPLPQDLGSKFLETSFNQTCTVTCNVPRIPCLDMSEVVNSITWDLANAILVHGGFRYNSTYVTVSGNFLITCDIHGKTVQTPLYLGATFVNNFDVILSNAISELIIDSGRKVRFTAGTTQTIAKATIGANVTLDCATASTYNLALTEIATAENANIKGCVVTQDSKFFAEANSVDSGSNNRVVFGDYFTVQEIIL